MCEKQVRGARRIWNLVSRMDELITTVLICNNLVNAAIASITTIIYVRFLGPEWGIVASTVTASVVLIVFCETTPKIFATKYPEFVTFSLRHLTEALIGLFSPMVRIATGVSNFLIKLVGKTPHSRMPLVTEEEIKLMIRIGKEEGYYGDGERRMLERIFHFDEIEVHEVMTPAEKMAAVDLNVNLKSLIDILAIQPHHRVPVYENDRNNIAGILYTKDLLPLVKGDQAVRLRELILPAYFVTPDKKVSALLKEFQVKKIQIAVVKTKEGRVIGVVTLEDLVEEIVGEIDERKSNDLRV